jgi:gliding motility-associated-like protein
MKKLYPLIVALLLSLTAFPQGQANNWYFGLNAGVTFNSGSPVALTNGALSTFEGCATISDKNGNLLFYTDGIRVWNRNHIQMANGFGMFGDPSSAQSAVVVPKPGSANWYFIFTVAAAGGAGGFCYSEVDMTQNGGLGDVVAATKNTPLFTPSAEKCTAVKHANGLYVWVIAQGFGTNAYHAYLVDCNGVGAAVTTNIGTADSWPGWGYLVASPNGHKLANALRNAGFEVLDFDNATGMVSNPIALGNPTECYGVSFSPDNNLLYGCKINDGTIWQWNLQAGSSAAIIASMFQVGTSTGSGYQGGALQIGPDGKIYFPQHTLAYLGAINNPNQLGAACGFTLNAVDLLGRASQLGLPPFIQSYFDTTQVIQFTPPNCTNRAVNFTVSSNTSYLDSVRWNFSDPASGTQNTSGQLAPSHSYAAAGNYTVQLIRYLDCVSDTTTRNIAITGPVNSSQSITICPNSTWTRPGGGVASAAGTYVDTIPASSTCDSIVTTNLAVAGFTVDAGNNTAICNGQSTQLNATGGLIYSWTPSTGLSDPNIANPVASPTSTTTYTVSSQSPIGNAIVNGDFNSGNTGFSSSYTYTTNNTTEGQYYVGPNASAWNGGMASCGDHTSGSSNMLCVNGATTANVSIYCQTVNVLPNTNYAFSTWLMTLSAGNPAQLQFSINGSLVGSVFTAPGGTCTWQQFYTTWNSGASTTATICIVNQNTIASANDFALDDISFSQLCTATDTVVVTVNPVYANTVSNFICQGDIYTLPDGSATTTAGTYVHTLSTVNGCDSVITTNLTVYPTYAYTVLQTICPSDVYIRPSGIPVNATGIYVDTLSTINGCDSIISTNLTVVPPSITVTNDTQICLGSSVQLNASGGLLSYTWTPTAGLDNSTIANPVATPTQTTSYIVTTQVASGDLIGNGDFTGGNAGFSSSYTYTTNLFPEATYYVGSNPNAYHSGFAACGDHTTGTGNMMIINGAGTPNTNVWCETINVVPNTNYAFGAWVTSVAAGSPAALQFEINGNLIGPVFNAPAAVCTWQQFYSIWNSGSNTTANICIINQNTTLGGNDFAMDDITFIGLCNVSDTVTITVHNPTTTTIDTAICQGYTYTFPSGATATSSTIDTSLLTDQFGCDSAIITNLTVNPTYAVTVDDTICSSLSYTLPSGNVVSATGTYIDTLQTINGCDSVVTTNLFVTPPPVTDVYDSICANQTYTLPGGTVASAAGNYNDTLITSAGCDSVVITHLYVRPTSATTVLDTICNGSVYTLPNGSTADTTGSYPVTLTNQYGCDSVVTTELTVINVSLALHPTDVLCNGGHTGSIVASASGGVNPYNYDLINNGSITSSNSTGSFNSLTAGNYTVNVTDDFGCTATADTTINEPPLLTSSAVTENVHCFGESNGQITISANGGTPAYAFNLSEQGSNNSGDFASLSAGSYGYTITDANGCTDTSSLIVTEPQAVLINLNPDSVVMNLAETAQLNASSNYDPSANYQWSPPIGLSCYDCPSPVVEIYNSIDYTVTVTTNIGGFDCSAQARLAVTVIPNYDIFIPNTFTPNGDGNNEFFQLFGNLPALKFVEISIFNRIGEKVFESNDLNFKWDGSYKGKLLPPAVYVYTLRTVFVDNHSEKIFTGSLTLLK